MSNQLLASKVIVTEEEPKVRSIAGVDTSIPVFLGLSQRGPVNEHVLLTSFDEYVDTFGGYTSFSDLTTAVQGFFENGGTACYIVRVVHLTDITNPATKTSAAGTLALATSVGAPSAGVVTGTNSAPFTLVNGDTLSLDVDAAGPVVATFSATAAARVSGATETFALTDAMTLTIEVDGGAVQTVTFDTAEFTTIGAATAAEVAAVINSELIGASAAAGAGAVTITSDSLGTGSSINVTGGTSNAVLLFTTGAIAGTGNVADITSVTVAEIKTIVEAAVPACTVSDVSNLVRITSNTTGAASSVLVVAASTADDEIGFDNATHSGDTGAASPTLTVDGKTDGAYSDALTVQVAAATSGEATEFNLFVLNSGLIVETFPNVDMDPTSSSYCVTVVNGAAGSKLIKLTDLLSTAADPRPAVGVTGPLTGGDDGLTALTDSDFVGSSAGPTGLRVIDTIESASILAVPGRATAAVHNAMVTYCEVTRNLSMFPIFDPPEAQTAVDAITYVKTTAQLLNLSEFGAYYWPRIKILNPSTSVFGTDADIVVPPSGHIAGCYARGDASRPGGIYRAPAGIESGRLLGVIGLETNEALDVNKLDLVYPNRINPITTFSGAPIHIDGNRTIKGGGNFPSIPERRGVIFIEQSLKRGLAFLKHQPNTADTRAVAVRTVTAFLLIQMKNGAFASQKPAEAFFVDASEGLNPASVRNAGQMIIRIGLATAKPTDWIILKISQDTRALENEIATAS